MYFNNEYRINCHSSFIIVKHWQLNQIFYVIKSWVDSCCQASLHWIFPVDVFHLIFFLCQHRLRLFTLRAAYCLIFALPLWCTLYCLQPRRGNLPAYVLWPNLPFRRSAFSKYFSWRLLLALLNFLPKCGGAQLCCLHIRPVISRGAYFK